MYGIYLIGVMIVTGGAIAFIGDKLGTKIGKKRLSIFGLRPRHTSMVITVITGGLITSLTIGAMAVASENVRTALFGMEELNAAMELSKTELAEVSGELVRVQGEYKKADSDLANSKEEIENLKSEQKELTEDTERLKSGNKILAEEKAELTAQNQSLSEKNSALETDNKKLTEFNLTLTSDNEKLTADKTELEERTKNLREGLIAVREGDIAFRAGEILASGIIKAGQSSEKVTEEISKIADAASKNIAERAGTQVDTSVWIYQPEMQQAIENISSGNGDIILQITAAGNLVRGEPVRTALSIHQNNFVYSKNEFIVSKNFEVNSASDAEPIVRNFLSSVNRAAVEKGILADPINGTVGVIEGGQLYALIDEIGKARGKIYLTAYARDDTYSVGPLKLQVKLEREVRD